MPLAPNASFSEPEASPIPAGRPKLKSRIRGCLFGCAYGDAMGAPVEKLTAEQIRASYGRVGTLATEWYRADEPAEDRRGRIRGNGIVTDDTLMTLCLVDIYNIARRRLDAWDLAGEMVRQIAWTPRWIPELQREAKLIERLFYPEQWIFIRHQLASCEPREGGIGNMVNCGAAMYAAPIGIANACDPEAAYAEAIDFCSGHQHSYGLEAAGVMAACVAAAFRPGASIDDVVAAAAGLAKDGTRAAIVAIADAARKMRAGGASHAEATAEFHKIIGDYSSIRDEVNRDPGEAGMPTDNYRPSRLRSIEELPIALGFCLLNDGDFERSVLDGVNSGRDTDSIGSMAGAILGAMHGESAIRADDRALLEDANRLDLTQIADTFCDTVVELFRKDHEREIARDRSRLELNEAQLGRQPRMAEHAHPEGLKREAAT